MVSVRVPCLEWQLEENRNGNGSTPNHSTHRQSFFRGAKMLSSHLCFVSSTLDLWVSYRWFRSSIWYTGRAQRIRTQTFQSLNSLNHYRTNVSKMKLWHLRPSCRQLSWYYMYGAHPLVCRWFSHQLGSKGMHLVIILEVWGGLTTYMYHRWYCVHTV